MFDVFFFFFFSSRRRHTRSLCDWSSDVCSSDLGGMLAVRHVADHPKTPKLVLLSAHCGGKDMLPLACKNGLLAQERLEAVTDRARKAKPKELLLMPGWWYAITAESFLDLANCPDILELAPEIGCPVLYVRGGKGPRALYPSEEFQK